MDIKKQIEYWISSAEDDIETAELLFAIKKSFMDCFSVISALKKV